jgi:hypothetical protein
LNSKRIIGASRLFTTLLVLGMTAGGPGCNGGAAPGKAAADPAASERPTENVSVIVDQEPGVVELTGAKVKIDEEKIARFEINYKFTSGKPVKHYLVEIAFIGAEHGGYTPIDPGTLKPEGVIKTGIEVGDRPIKDFEITFSEADSPMAGFTKISNTLKGSIEPPATPDPAVTPSPAGS